MFKGIRYIGVIVGWLLYISVSFAATVVFAVGIILFGGDKITSDDIRDIMLAPLSRMIMFFIDGGMTFIGGFVAASMAKTHRLKNAFAVWICYVITTIYLTLVQPESPLHFSIFDYLGELFAACLGGLFAKWIFKPRKT